MLRVLICSGELAFMDSLTPWWQVYDVNLCGRLTRCELFFCCEGFANLVWTSEYKTGFSAVLNIGYNTIACSLELFTHCECCL